MFHFLGFGLAVGAGIQAWRNIPPDGPVSSDMAFWVLVVAVVLAYLGGRSRRGAYASATATASATAEATAAAHAQQAVQVFITNGEGGARPVGYSIPTGEAPWLATSAERPALTLDQLDGMDLAEFSEETAKEEA